MRVGGLIQVQTGGVIQNAKGDFDYNIGRPIRKAVVGSDGVHGYTEEAQPAFIEGKITDRGDLDLNALVMMKDVTVTLAAANGKVIVLRNAWYAGEGTVNTGEGEIVVRYESKIGEEVA